MNQFKAPPKPQNLTVEPNQPAPQKTPETSPVVEFNPDFLYPIQPQPTMQSIQPIYNQLQNEAKQGEQTIINNLYQERNPDQSPQPLIEDYNGPTLEFIDWLSPKTNPNRRPLQVFYPDWREEVIQ